MGNALKRPASAKKTASGAKEPNGGKKAGVNDKDGVASDERLVRVAKKRAFVLAETKKGNPAAQLMMARILKEGWGVKKDEEAAASLRSEGIKGMCAALKDKAEEEPLCSNEGDGGNGGVLPDAASVNKADVMIRRCLRQRQEMN